MNHHGHIRAIGNLICGDMLGYLYWGAAHIRTWSGIEWRTPYDQIHRNRNPYTRFQTIRDHPDFLTAGRFQIVRINAGYTPESGNSGPPESRG